MSELPNLAPADTYEFSKDRGRTLLIACGALAREIIDLIELNDWHALDVTCLPAKWHNTPDLITDGVRRKIRENRSKYDKMYVVYGDCGTGGLLDKMLREEQVDRIDGPHCYSFFSGNDAFARISEKEITAFYLTDYLVRHFDKLVWEGFGLNRHPDIRDMMFAHYEKVVYLAQIEDEALKAKAEEIAERLKLAYEYRFTGYGDLAADMARLSG